jgi:hypothetical protein
MILSLSNWIYHALTIVVHSSTYKGGLKMFTIVDYNFQEVPKNSGILPITVGTASPEIFLTSIFLNITSLNNKIVIRGNVAWKAIRDVQIVKIPKFTFRVRRGGTGTDGTVVFQSTDSHFLKPIFQQAPFDPHTSFIFIDEPTQSMVGTFQQYFLTVQFTGRGSATITGPLNLIGKVLV